MPEEDEEAEVPAVNSEALEQEVPQENEAEVPAVNSDAFEEVPQEDEVPAVNSDTFEQSDVEERDEEEAVIEEVSTDEATDVQDAPKKTKTVEVEEWSRLNSQPPLWTRYA